MEIIGTIAEYNPFHNGHQYHLKKIKELYPDSVIVLVLNGYFLQRGDVSIQTKENKVKVALHNNADIIVELPCLYGTQSADIFADKAMEILAKFHVNRVIIGSEINDASKLIEIAQLQLQPDFDDKVKEYIDLGNNYPTALAKALNQDFDYTPNDLLGIAYAKAIAKHNYSIKLETIKRTNDYHDIILDDSIVSASNIRKRIEGNEDVSKYMPHESYSLLTNIDQTLLFNLIKYQILVSDNLDNYLDVTEGLDHVLKNAIIKSKSIDELIQNVKSKRYTYNKIKRMLIHILLGIKKEDVKAELAYLTILGFSTEGKNYIKNIKKELQAFTQKDYNSVQYKTEMKASQIYDLITANNTTIFEKSNKPIQL